MDTAGKTGGDREGSPFPPLRLPVLIAKQRCYSINIMNNDTKRRSYRQNRRPSGRFVVRIGTGLHALLRAAAAEADISLNDYCALKLSCPAGNPGQLQDSAQVIQKAAAEFGDKLLAVAVYGSWARGEAERTSDVDLLLVLDSGVKLARDLYRHWDQHPLCWEKRPLEVHFAHLPEADHEVRGIWAELALDGLVLFERDFQLSRLLSRVRKQMLAGRIVRKTVHGQPYWIEVA